MYKRTGCNGMRRAITFQGAAKLIFTDAMKCPVAHVFIV
jgi:hypothetical protein